MDTTGDILGKTGSGEIEELPPVDMTIYTRALVREWCRWYRELKGVGQ